MDKINFVQFTKHNWGRVLLIVILLTIIFLNFKSGYFVLGNDNFSPELNPSLTLERSVFSPAFRTYRVLGIPSDSEQSDIFRTSMFLALSNVLPKWLISQGYLFFTFFIASVSMGYLTQYFVRRYFFCHPRENGDPRSLDSCLSPKGTSTTRVLPSSKGRFFEVARGNDNYNQIAFLLGGLFYTSNLLTSWIYFFPVQLFVAAYAFLPFVIWRMYCLFEKRSIKNVLLLTIASMLLSTAALTATMFIICSLVIVLFSAVFFLEKAGEKSKLVISNDSERSLLGDFSPAQRGRNDKGYLNSLRALLFTLFIVLGIQLFWALPFVTYVKTNTQPLRDSYINRDITTKSIENEAKHNTALNSVRYLSSWLDTQEDRNTYTFAFRDWYKNNVYGQILSFIPVILAIAGFYFIFKEKRKYLLIIPFAAFFGWFAIKGVNPPLGFTYSFLQDNFPVVAQVFRWQSSKLWPFLAMTFPILATIGLISIHRLLGEIRKKPIIPKQLFYRRHAFVIPAQAGIQEKTWIPHQVRDDKDRSGMTDNRVQDDGRGDTIVSFSISRSGLYRFGSLIATLFINLFFRVLIVAVILGLLVYVYPFFKGGLIREKSFVKVPNEYFELSEYLTKNDKFSRIYLSPEANTLYFRTYSWGFWGSVVLNYLLPNPIIEKAMVIGSKESEDAFKILVNAYYSEDPKIFVSALKLYETSLVLSDENAVKGDVGYFYNWELHKKMIDENPDLELIWQKGNLSLHRLKQYGSVDAERLSFQNDSSRLNTILAGSIDDYKYFTKDNENGAIYPFAFKYGELQFKNKQILLNGGYKGEDANYNLSVTDEALRNSPTGITLNRLNKELVFYPLFPNLKINEKEYKYDLPLKKYALSDNPSFVSIDDKVLDFRNNSDRAIDTYYYQIGGEQTNVKTWGETHQKINLLSQNNIALFTCDNMGPDNFFVSKDKKAKCATTELTINKDAVVRLDVAFKSNNPVRALLCVKSNYKQRCMNRNTATFISGETKISTILVPEVFQQNDLIKLFLDFDVPPQQETYDSFISITKLDLIAYEAIEEPELAEEREVFDQELIIPLKKGDEISFSIPTFEGTDNWTLRREDMFIPEASISSFNEKEKPFSGKIFINKDESLEITNMESNGGIYPKLDVLNPRGGIGFIAFSAENISGIPAKIFIRGANLENRLWEDQLKTKAKGEVFDLFQMPNEAKSYYLEVFSTALGPRPSKNVINNLVFQVIPQSWYSLNLALNPVYKKEIKLKEAKNVETNTYKGEIEDAENSIVSIPTAYSPYWNLDIFGASLNNCHAELDSASRAKLDEERSRNKFGMTNGGVRDDDKCVSPVLINGWKQGWEINADTVGDAASVKVIFFPNKLAYLGFLPLVGIIFWIIVLGVKEVFKKINKNNF